MFTRTLALPGLGGLWHNFFKALGVSGGVGSRSLLSVGLVEASSCFSSSIHLLYTGKTCSSFAKKLTHRRQILIDAGLFTNVTPTWASLWYILGLPANLSKMLLEYLYKPTDLMFCLQKRQKSFSGSISTTGWGFVSGSNSTRQPRFRRSGYVTPCILLIARSMSQWHSSLNYTRKGRRHLYAIGCLRSLPLRHCVKPANSHQREKPEKKKSTNLLLILRKVIVHGYLFDSHTMSPDFNLEARSPQYLVSHQYYCLVVSARNSKKTLKPLYCLYQKHFIFMKLLLRMMSGWYPSKKTFMETCMINLNISNERSPLVPDIQLSK